MADKPVFKPEWATDDAILPEAGTGNKIRPTEELRLTGYDYKQKPTAQELNWILNNIFEWVDYLETTTDAVGITDIASQAEAEAGAINTAIMTPLRTKQYTDQYGLGDSKKITGGDLDNIVLSGFYFTEDCLNFPAGEGIFQAHLQVLGSNDEPEVLQILTDVSDTASIFYRKKFAGVWSSWVPFTVGPPGEISQQQSPYNNVFGHTHELNLDSFFDNSQGEDNQLIAGDGYQKLPGGLILQWGKAAVGDNTIVTVDLPIAFPTTCLSVTAMPDYDSSVSGEDVLSCHGTVVNNSQIKIGMSRNVVITTSGVYWMVIGY